MKNKILIYAPNVNTGGGLTLLVAILTSWNQDVNFNAFLDIRVKDKISLPKGSTVFWVYPTVLSRFKNELTVRKISRNFETILCFHGMPPMFSLGAEVVVFHQNRNYFGLNSLFDFPLKVALRLLFERSICYFFRWKVDHYIIQTPSMERELRKWFGKGVDQKKVSISPFNAEIFNLNKLECFNKWDLIYISDGAAHKNHKVLIEALVLLSKENIFPFLALTLGERDRRLVDRIVADTRQYNLQIENLGHQSHEQILKSLKSSKALIFPSKSESFGLPLIEAASLQIPIIASELDFVRDVCSPSESFDPSSATSIARAIKRQLGYVDEPIKIRNAKEFMETVLSR